MLAVISPNHADSSVMRHHYQNVADWWSTDEGNLSLEADMSDQAHPSSSYGNISDDQLACNTTPPAAPAPGHHGNTHLLYENIFLSVDNN